MTRKTFQFIEIFQYFTFYQTNCNAPTLEAWDLYTIEYMKSGLFQQVKHDNILKNVSFTSIEIDISNCFQQLLHQEHFNSDDILMWNVELAPMMNAHLSINLPRPVYA